MDAVTLPCGVVLQAEVKTRSKAPALLTKALAQAHRYSPDAVPAVVLSETGGEPLIVLPLRDFRRIAGIEGPQRSDPQLALTFPELGADELLVLTAIAGRLRIGQAGYGPLDVAGDRRDWRHEAAEELLDGCVYLACEVMRRKEG